MRTLGITLFVIGGVIFGITILYCIHDARRTGILYRKKKVMIPPAIVGWLIAMSGMLTLFLDQES
jgi:hypothetical protein